MQTTEDLPWLLVRVLIALGIGFLIGLEREYAKRVVDKEEQFAGLRTYTFIALFGFTAAFLSAEHAPWAFLVGLGVLAALVIAAYIKTATAGSIGMTTELAAILTYLLGGLVFHGHILLAVIATVVVTVLLSLKTPLHKFVTTLTNEEIHAFIQFVVISAVVLPFLPDVDFGPYAVWNLKDIWIMVVLVAGISLAGYLLSKILGNKGTLLAGILGGMVSSTAVTLSFSRQAGGRTGGSAVLAAVCIIAASSIMFLRVLVEATVLNPALGLRLAPAVVFVAAAGLVAAWAMHRRRKGAAEQDVPLKNPLNFRVAVQFAVIYMAVQWLVAFASDRYGTEGVYIASLLSGATDMDAITLSMARQGRDAGQLMTGVIAILLASLSNTVVKFLIVLFVGGTELRKAATVGFAAMFAAVLISVVVVWVM